MKVKQNKIKILTIIGTLLATPAISIPLLLNQNQNNNQINLVQSNKQDDSTATSEYSNTIYLRFDVLNSTNSNDNKEENMFTTTLTSSDTANFVSFTLTIDIVRNSTNSSDVNQILNISLSSQSPINQSSFNKYFQGDNLTLITQALQNNVINTILKSNAYSTSNLLQCFQISNLNPNFTWNAMNEDGSSSTTSSNDSTSTSTTTSSDQSSDITEGTISSSPTYNVSNIYLDELNNERNQNNNLNNTNKQNIQQINTLNNTQIALIVVLVVLIVIIAVLVFLMIRNKRRMRD